MTRLATALLLLLPSTAAVPAPAREAPWAALREAQRAVDDATGLRFAWLSSLVRRSLVCTDTPWGFSVAAVERGSTAEVAGLREGDVVLGWGDVPLRSLIDLGERVADATPGTRVEVLVARRDREASWLSRDPWHRFRTTMELHVEPSRR